MNAAHVILQLDGMILPSFTRLGPSVLTFVNKI